MTQEQRKIVAEIFKDKPSVDEVLINPKGEFFTEESYALNSLPKDKDGKRDASKLQRVKRQVKKD
ncbi:hypothetical protein ABMY20_12675 [Tenacibaculum sp. SSH1-16]|uniref:hypothetical protein n=1 Tax=Tenacibaculum sp. SSH1-16 TaxID=3136667 RepID=UPI0032C48A0D